MFPSVDGSKKEKNVTLCVEQNALFHHVVLWDLLLIYFFWGEFCHQSEPKSEEHLWMDERMRYI